MSSYQSSIRRATDALDGVRAGAPAGELPSWSSGQVMAQIASVGELRKACDALLVSLSGELASRSPRDDRSRNLTRQAGFASPAALVAETAGINIAESAKLGRVAAALEPTLEARAMRTEDTADSRAEQAPAPKYPHVHDAFTQGHISTEQVDVITRMLDDTLGHARASAAAGVESATRTDTMHDTLHDTLEAAGLIEEALVELAPTVRLNDLKKAVEHARATLAPEQLAHREAAQRAARALRFVTKANGMIEIVWTMTPDQAALVKPGIDAGARALGRGKNTPQPEPAGTIGNLPDDVARFDLTGQPINAGATQLVQLRADAAFHIFEHAASCRATGKDAGTPVPAFHAVVRVDLDALRDALAEADSSLGYTAVAELDGIVTPISAGLARRIAAKAGIIPAVMGSSDVPLNLGMKTRLFTSAQRTALIDRDGGCAWPGCDTAPEFSDAHHLAWWAREHGPTDLTNGIMLCSSHHHRIHDNGWQIEFDHPADDPDGCLVPWFIPPPEWVAADPQHRTRLQGGNPIKALQHQIDQARDRRTGLPTVRFGSAAAPHAA